MYVAAYSLASEMPLTGVQYREKSKKPSDRLSANARRAAPVIYHVAVKIFDLWIGNIAVYGCRRARACASAGKNRRTLAEASNGAGLTRIEESSRVNGFIGVRGRARWKLIVRLIYGWRMMRARITAMQPTDVYCRRAYWAPSGFSQISNLSQSEIDSPLKVPSADLCNSWNACRCFQLPLRT